MATGRKRHVLVRRKKEHGAREKHAMTIRDCFVEIVDALPDPGPGFSGLQDHRINKDASRDEVVRHTQNNYGISSHYSGSKDPYTRYNGRYRNCIRYQLAEFAHSPNPNQPILHVDIGCGPGGFTWAIVDQIREQDGRQRRPLHLFGYDHSPEMVALADELGDSIRQKTGAEHFPVAYYFDDSEALLREITMRIADSSPEIIITFGYVLIQTFERDHNALDEFCQIINALTKIKSQPKVLLWAVDGHRDGMGDTFGEAWNAFTARLARMFPFQAERLEKQWGRASATFTTRS